MRILLIATYHELVNREWALETAVEDLTQAHSKGVETIVEVSPLDLGREVSLMKEVAERSGVQFIYSTSCWLDVPRSFWGRTPEFIAALWAREIAVGIEGTDIRASSPILPSWQRNKAPTARVLFTGWCQAKAGDQVF